MLDMRKCREWAVDRSQNMGPNYGKFFRHSWAVRGCSGLNWGVYMVIYGINYASVFKTSEMGKKFGSKKNETEVGHVGCPWTAHCWVSGLLKTVPGLCEMAIKAHVFWH